MPNHVRMSVRVRLRLPDDVVAAIDRAAGPTGRSEYVAEAIRERIHRDERLSAARDAAGAWRDNPLFPTSDAVVDWVRAGRAERTDPGPTLEDR